MERPDVRPCGGQRCAVAKPRGERSANRRKDDSVHRDGYVALEDVAPMKQVLAIMGSPRRGDSYHLIRRIEEVMTGLGEVEFDYLWLRDADLRTCRGCCACIVHGEQHCPHDDDRAEIERRILGADGIVFASPVYAMGMTALLKNLLDRLAYAMHRPRFFDQKVLIAVCAGVAGIKQTQQAIAAVSYMGFDMSGGRVGLTVPFRPWTQSEQRHFDRETDRAGRRFLSALQSNRRSAPSFMDLALFRMRQSGCELSREQFPADYEYVVERGWHDRSRRYYVDAPVNPLYDLGARILGSIARRQSLARERVLRAEAATRAE